MTDSEPVVLGTQMPSQAVAGEARTPAAVGSGTCDCARTLDEGRMPPERPR
jgi:hypothetical protein